MAEGLRILFLDLEQLSYYLLNSFNFLYLN